MPSISEIKYKVPKALAKFAAPNLPKDAKMAAAKGVLPIPPEDLVQVLFTLTYDKDEEVKKSAAASLINMPENILKTVLTDSKAHPLIINYMAKRLSPDSPLQEVIVLNRVTHDDTVAFQATLPNKRVVDIIVENQMRLMRSPNIVDSLAENLIVGQAQLEKIIKFVEMENKKSASKASDGEGMEVEIEEITAEEKPKPHDPGLEEDDDEISSVTQLDDDEIGAVTEGDDGTSPWELMSFDEDLLKDHNLEDEEEEEGLGKNLAGKIAKMPVSKKIKLALLGGGEARAILIKDTNKVVSTAVLKSPRITEKEIDMISKSRAVNDDVIRLIANSRDWTRNYNIKMNLIQNPKTPTPDAFRFMNFLRDKDLKDIAKSRNVPNNVSSQAKRLMKRKEEKKKPGAKH